MNRRSLFWELGRVRYEVAELDLDFGEDEVTLPEVSLAETVNMEFQAMGLSTQTQIMALYREYLTDRNVLSSKQLAKANVDAFVKTAGLLVIRQSPPTAKGTVFYP